MPPTIKHLLQNNQIWQGSQQSNQRPALSTGYTQLDKVLHYGGWPQGAVSELLLNHHGIGEVRLLSPLLAKLSQQPGYITWINPPYRPYAPALASLQLALNKIIIIKPKTTQESVWAAQQALASGACSAVLIWLPNKTLSNEIRKLSLAAKTGNCWGLIFRFSYMQQQPSAAALRIVMQSQSQQQQLSIIKQPGGWSGQKLTLDLFPERVHWTSLSVNQWPSFTPTPVVSEKPSKHELMALPGPVQARLLPYTIDECIR